MRLPDSAFSPLTYLLLLTVLLVVGWRRLPRWARWGGLFLEILLLAMIAPVGANVMVRWVESQAPAAQACASPRPDTIVVLAGGTDRRALSAYDYDALSAASLQRLFAGVALWKREPVARFVIAGGGGRIAEATLMAGLAEQMGVPRSVIELDADSHTTWENAENVAKLSPAVPRHIWLVSSALHLPRALRAFRAWGFQPCAWSSGSLYVPFGFNPGYFMPQTSALGKADRAIHEIVGGLAYAWRARHMPTVNRGTVDPKRTATY